MLILTHRVSQQRTVGILAEEFFLYSFFEDFVKTEQSQVFWLLWVNCLEVTKGKNKSFTLREDYQWSYSRLYCFDIFLNTWREEMNGKRIERIIES